MFKKLITIIGPTASGKTELALKLAKEFNGEIICADSRTVYKEMDIGTAKIKSKIKNQKSKIRVEVDSKIYNLTPIIYKDVPHWLIDVVYPNEIFTVAMFQKMAQVVMEDIWQRRKIPFLVGGTGLYVDAVVKGYIIPKLKIKKQKVKILRRQLEKKTAEQLWKQLQKLDPEALKKIHPHNKRRLIRALEVCLITGKPFSQQQKMKKPNFEVLEIGLKIDRDKLYQKIDKRVEKMVKKGLVREVKKLSRKYGWEAPAMSGIGYREFKQIRNSKFEIRNLKKIIEEIKKNTRHYARRQMTWFKRNKNIYWIENYTQAKKLIKEFLK